MSGSRDEQHPDDDGGLIPFEPDPIPAPARPAPKPKPVAPLSKPAAVPPPKKPVKPAAPDPKLDVCPECGYSLVALKSSKCPECGADVSITALRSIRRHEESSKQLKGEYKRILLTVILGVIAVAALQVLRTWLRGSIDDVPLQLAARFIGLLVSVPIGFFAYFGLSIMWFGVDMPWGLAFFRLCAVYVLADAAELVFSIIPLFIFAFLLSIYVYFYLLEKYMELESYEAIILALVTWFIRFIAIVWALTAMGLI